jgi:flagellar protein FliS
MTKPDDWRAVGSQMMAAQDKYKAYAAATQTVAKTRQIVMLYDGAIRFMQQSKEAIHDRRIEDRYHLLIRASDVVTGLQSCLDFENGGDIARVLYQFYAAIDLKIFSIHRSNSVETCDEVISDLKQMRDVWNEIDMRDSLAQSNEGIAEVSMSGKPSPDSGDSPLTLSV